jgi:protein-tyrosine sulfotransferase
MSTESGRELGLIVGAARSGTTLLRLILDAHPEIGCPAEAGLPGLMSHMARVWATIDADIRDDANGRDPGERMREGPGAAEVAGEVAAAQQVGGGPPGVFGDLPSEARAWIRAAVLDAVERYCGRDGKRLYVDKSLDSVHHLALVTELFPGVRHVLVFRHVMDAVASGIEASPWGFHAYGYAPYVQTSPGNTVAALAGYWLDHVERALRWEKEYPEACHRVRYEDLVLDPREMVGGVLRFLGVEEDLSVLRGAFDRGRTRGPGDYKVEHTSRVHTASMGRGKRVPVTMLPPPLLKALNEKLDLLGYEPLDRSWNARERPVDVDDDLWSRQLRDLMGRVRINDADPAIGSFAVVAEDHRALRWVVETEAGTVTRGDGEVEGVLTGTAEDLVLMVNGDENLGVLVRSGRIRYLVADEDNGARRDLPRDLTVLLALLQNGALDSRD